MTVLTELLVFLAYLATEFGTGLLFMWLWGKMFDVQLGRRKMVWGAIFWVVSGMILGVVFHL